MGKVSEKIDGTVDLINALRLIKIEKITIIGLLILLIHNNLTLTSKFEQVIQSQAELTKQVIVAMNEIEEDTIEIKHNQQKTTEKK